MLTEIALTPHTFEPCTISASRWAEQLRALTKRLNHYGSLCPVVFSNLNSGHASQAWLKLITQKLAAGQAAKVRAARDLLDRIQRDRLLVERPSQHQVQAANKEDQWVNEAIRPSPTYPIDQIVCSFQGLGACRKVYTKVLGINDLEAADFWKTVATSGFPSMTIADQMKTLRPLWLHGKVLAVVLPYALERYNNGTVHGEASWFFALAAHAFGRPAGHGQPKIELHVSYDGNGADVVAQQASHPAVADFISAARGQPELRGRAFSLYVRARSNGSQRFIARRLFAGEERIEDPAAPDVRVRWGIAMEHVAHPNDVPNQTPPTFTLLPWHQADQQFRFECQNAGPRLAGPIPVRC